MAALFLAGTAQAGTVSLIIENDSIGGTDRNYTAGQKLIYVTDGKDSADRIVTGAFGRTLVDIIYGLDNLSAQNHDGVRANNIVIHEAFALGQNIFTPEDILTATPLPDQHPYAGWLYGSYSLFGAYQNMVDTFAVDIGVVGPSAFGEEVQRGFHQLIDGEDPKGWDNQLKNEPGITLTYQRQWRYDLGETSSGLGFDVLPTLGASAGNILTQANTGGTLRIGYGLGNDFGPPRIRPSLAGTGYFDPPGRGYTFYLFAGVEGRAVLQNLFLDGNTFRDSLNVQRKPLVADFQMGAVFQTGNVQVAYTFVVRTEEFDGQQGEQKFGAVNLSVRF